MRHIIALLLLGTVALAAEPRYVICTTDGSRLVRQTDLAWTTITSNEWRATDLPAYTVLVTEAEYATNRVLYPPLPPDPAQFADGIESPVLVLQTVDGKGVGVVADGLDLITYVDHASPRPDAATLAARVAAAKAERQALRDVLKDIRVETTNNIADCVTISASTTNTANAAQGTQIKKLADELADANRQLNRLRKALLDYLRGTE